MTEKQIAETIMESWRLREESYDPESKEYKRDIEECLIEAGKKYDLSKNMWALLDLVLYWPNDAQLWCEDVLAGRNILDQVEKDVDEEEGEG